MFERLEQIGDLISFRDASIRAKVMFAFLGVLLLILPQIVLTVTYMVELFQGGEVVDRSSGASLVLGEIHTDLEQHLIAPFPTSQEEFETNQAALAEVTIALRSTETQFAELKNKDGRFGTYLEALKAVRGDLATYLTTLEEDVTVSLGVNRPIKRREVTSRIDQELDDLFRAWDEPPIVGEEALNSTPEERLLLLRRKASSAIQEVVRAQNSDDTTRTVNSASQVQRASRTWSQKRVLLRKMGTLQAIVNSENERAAERIKASVDEANRYLITLVLLTLVYIFVIILVLPSRLVRPLVHFTSVVERAATGQLEVRARVAGDDEMGDLGKGLNVMLERLGTFDRLKRDRIYEDDARIRSLGDRLESPLAIVDTHFAFEYANKSMRKLLLLGDGYEGSALMDIMGGRDAHQLVSVLDKALKRRRSLDTIPIELKTAQGLKSLLLSTQIGRNRSGHISYIIVTLVE
jgi:hypothetical protein